MHNIRIYVIIESNDQNKSVSIESIPVSSLMSKSVKTETSDQNILGSL